MSSASIYNNKFYKELANGEPIFIGVGLFTIITRSVLIRLSTNHESGLHITYEIRWGWGQFGKSKESNERRLRCPSGLGAASLNWPPKSWRRVPSQQRGRVARSISEGLPTAATDAAKRQEATRAFSFYPSLSEVADFHYWWASPLPAVAILLSIPTTPLEYLERRREP